MTKLKLFFLCSPWQQHKVKYCPVKIGDCTVAPSKSAKNRGVVLDCHLSMDAHIKAICKKSHFHLHNLSKIRCCLSKDAQHKIVHAFISSKLDCNNTLLYGLPKYQTDKLQRIQNSSARLVTRMKKQDHITPVLKSLHWLLVLSRIR